MSDIKPLGHVGIYLILEALTVSMEHIDLCGRDVSYSFKSFVAILHKVKSIHFTAPDDHKDCEIIYETLANTTMLQELKISGISNLNHLKLLSAIGRNITLTVLEIKYGTFTYGYAKNLVEFIKTNKSLLYLGLYSRNLSPEGLLLIADSD